MSNKERGQEVTITVSRTNAAGQSIIIGGTMAKITDFTATPRTEIKEDDYLGEAETDLDIQHHGWDMSWSCDQIDEALIDMTDDTIAREKAHETPADVTVTVIHAFREPGAKGRIEVYHQVFLKQDDEGFAGRKEKVKCKLTGKCKTRTVMKA